MSSDESKKNRTTQMEFKDSYIEQVAAGDIINNLGNSSIEDHVLDDIGFFKIIDILTNDVVGLCTYIGESYFISGENKDFFTQGKVFLIIHTDDTNELNKLKVRISYIDSVCLLQLDNNSITQFEKLNYEPVYITSTDHANQDRTIDFHFNYLNKSKLLSTYKKKVPYVKFSDNKIAVTGDTDTRTGNIFRFDVGSPSFIGLLCITTDEDGIRKILPLTDLILLPLSKYLNDQKSNIKILSLYNIEKKFKNILLKEYEVSPWKLRIREYTLLVFSISCFSWLTISIYFIYCYTYRVTFPEFLFLIFSLSSIISFIIAIIFCVVVVRYIFESKNNPLRWFEPKDVLTHMRHTRTINEMIRFHIDFFRRSDELLEPLSKIIQKHNIHMELEDCKDPINIFLLGKEQNNG